MQPKATAQSIYDELRRMIMDFKIDPGVRFTETQVASFFNVSRTPVRAALQRLEVEGQIIVRPKQGCFVRTIDMVQISDFYDVRVALERMVIENLMSAPNNRQALDTVAELARKWDPERKQFGSVVSEELKYEEEMFHIELAETTRNQALVNYLDDLNQHIRAVRRLGWPDQVSVDDTYKEHYRICEFILANDKTGAEEEMVNHIRKSQDMASRITLKQLYDHKKTVVF